MFASASGVLKQRAMPNSRCSPSVVPNTPPLPSTSPISSSGASATSSPNTRMRSSAAITSCSVRRIASPKATTSPSAGAGPGSVDRRAAPARGRAPSRATGGARRAPPWPPRPPRRRPRCGSASTSLAGGPAPCDHELLEQQDRVVRRARPASSSSDRYFVCVSAAEWEYGRVTVAWSRPGPSPARTRATASRPALAAGEVVAAVDLRDRRARGSPRTISEIGAVAWSSERTEMA